MPLGAVCLCRPKKAFQEKNLFRWEGCETCSACKKALKHLTTKRPSDKTVVKILNNPKGDDFNRLNFYFVGTVALNVILICRKQFQ